MLRKRKKKRGTSTWTPLPTATVWYRSVPKKQKGLLWLLCACRHCCVHLWPEYPGQRKIGANPFSWRSLCHLGMVLKILICFPLLSKTRPTRQALSGRVGWELLSAFTTEEEQKGFPAPLAGTLGEVPGHLQNTSCWRAGECKQLSCYGETAVDVTQTKPACYWSGKTNTGVRALQEKTSIRALQ